MLSQPQLQRPRMVLQSGDPKGGIRSIRTQTPSHQGQEGLSGSLHRGPRAAVLCSGAAGQVFKTWRMQTQQPALLCWAG